LAYEYAHVGTLAAADVIELHNEWID